MIDTRRLATWIAALAILLAGCSAPSAGPSGATDAPVDRDSAAPTVARTEAAAATDTTRSGPGKTATATTAGDGDGDGDRDGDGDGGEAGISGEIVVRVGSDADGRLGWEAGYAHDEPIDVTLEDGLSVPELEAYLARSMARVEFIRGHEFTRPIAIEVITREQVRRKVEETGSFLSNDPLTDQEVRIMNTFWEALFFVGEDADVRTVRAAEQSSFLGAYYLFGSDRITVVTAAPERVVIAERLLIHDLVHALQDEYADTPLETRSDDDNYATSALIEGDATAVEYRYRERCESGAWECVPPPSTASGGSDGAADVHRGFRILRQFAYSDGPWFVQSLYRRGVGNETGWDAVDRAFEVRPRTTEEIIHPEEFPSAGYRRPATNATPRAGWKRIGGPYAVGEAEIFAMLWYQDAGYGIRVIDTDSFDEPEGGPYDWKNYTSAPSAGWDGDGLEIYAKGNETGYVWITTWDTRRDARQFHRAYLDVLAGHGARVVDGGRRVLPGGEYADAFWVRREGRRVVVVNGPSLGDLPNIYPSIGR